jgi:uncharacterized protein (DUF1330 family)
MLRRRRPADVHARRRERKGQDVTTKRKITLAGMAGVLVGAVAARAIQAPQRKEPPGYFVAEIEVTDPVAMQKYGERVPETLAPFHHHYVVRGGKPKALEGEPPRGVVVIAFDSVAEAREWYESPAYRALISLRQSASKGRLFLVEGPQE